ncbi:MAG: hypothetical protein CMG88_09855 [Marinobacter sp.]|nr:hypothetical protein [Marinobacter sp.]
MGRLGSAIHGSAQFWEDSPTEAPSFRETQNVKQPRAFVPFESRALSQITSFQVAISRSQHGRAGSPVQDCAEPWMAELKRHMDVLERILNRATCLAETPDQ